MILLAIDKAQQLIQRRAPSQTANPVLLATVAKANAARRVPPATRVRLATSSAPHTHKRLSFHFACAHDGSRLTRIRAVT